MGKDKFKKIEAILYSYRDIKAEIKCLEIELRTEEDEFRGCGAIEYSSESSKSNSFNSTVENEVIERERKLNKIKKTLKNKKALIEKIDAILESLPTVEKDLLEYKYFGIENLSWEDISEKLKFSQEHCRKNIRKKAITKFAKALFM